jgi:hypothetical protein
MYPLHSIPGRKNNLQNRWLPTPPQPQSGARGVGGAACLTDIIKISILLPPKCMSRDDEVLRWTKLSTAQNRPKTPPALSYRHRQCDKNRSPGSSSRPPRTHPRGRLAHYRTTDPRSPPPIPVGCRTLSCRKACPPRSFSPVGRVRERGSRMRATGFCAGWR